MVTKIDVTARLFSITDSIHSECLLGGFHVVRCRDVSSNSKTIQHHRFHPFLCVCSVASMSCDVVMSVGPVHDALLGAATATGACHSTTASSGGLVHVSCRSDLLSSAAV